MRKFTIIIVMVVSMISLPGCTAFWQAFAGDPVRQGQSSSLVNFLYPDGMPAPQNQRNVPRLELPLRVGLAFVPESQRHYSVQALSEEQQQVLLGRVKDTFIEQKFIADIQLIPTMYLQRGNGFDNLEQVARLYDLDVVGLVSYDQVTFIEDRKYSILYWTVIGAYTIHGTENEVQTFVDTAVFDINSRQLLFRAGGVDRHSKNSTLQDSTKVARKSQTQGFELAMADMTTNLETELLNFQERVKNDKVVEIVHRGGGGSLDILSLCLLLLLGTYVYSFQPKRFTSPRKVITSNKPQSH